MADSISPELASDAGAKLQALIKALEPLRLIHSLVSIEHAGRAHPSFPLMRLEGDPRIRLSFGQIDDILHALHGMEQHHG